MTSEQVESLKRQLVDYNPLIAHISLDEDIHIEIFQKLTKLGIICKPNPTRQMKKFEIKPTKDQKYIPVEAFDVIFGFNVPRELFPQDLPEIEEKAPEPKPKPAEIKPRPQERNEKPKPPEKNVKSGAISIMKSLGQPQDNFEPYQHPSAFYDDGRNKRQYRNDQYGDQGYQHPQRNRNFDRDGNYKNTYDNGRQHDGHFKRRPDYYDNYQNPEEYPSLAPKKNETEDYPALTPKKKETEDYPALTPKKKETEEFPPLVSEEVTSKKPDEEANSGWGNVEFEEDQQKTSEWEESKTSAYLKIKQEGKTLLLGGNSALVYRIKELIRTKIEENIDKDLDLDVFEIMENIDTIQFK